MRCRLPANHKVVLGSPWGELSRRLADVTERGICTLPPPNLPKNRPKPPLCKGNSGFALPVAGLRVAAASGRKRRPAISAAVEKPEDQRKPERFFGHRNPARSDNPEVVGSNPSPATTSRGCSGFPLHPLLFCRLAVSHGLW